MTINYQPAPKTADAGCATVNDSGPRADYLAAATLRIAAGDLPSIPHTDLTLWDAIIVSSSAGKDSLAMLHAVCTMAAEQGVLGRVHVVHADLGAMEWDGVAELAARQAARYGVSFEVVVRPQGDLLHQVEHQRGKWPAPGGLAQYCTSDHKTSQIQKVYTRLAKEVRKATGKARPRILDCLGLRARESTARSTRPAWEETKRASNSVKECWKWNPILAWSCEDVWVSIEANGLEYHRAYDLGMSRLSCCFCIMGSKADLEISAKANPELLDRYVEVEDRIDFTFQHGKSLRDLRDRVQG